MAIDVQSLFFVLIDQLMPIAERLRAIGQRAIERLARRCDESDRAIVECEDDDVAFVDLSMMMAAQTNEIREFCFAAVSPMLYMMAIEIASVRAAWEAAAAAIARVERAV